MNPVSRVIPGGDSSPPRVSQGRGRHRLRQGGTSLGTTWVGGWVLLGQVSVAGAEASAVPSSSLSTLTGAIVMGILLALPMAFLVEIGRAHV